jgi:rhodanese-related sulfurtransferase
MKQVIFALLILIMLLTACQSKPTEAASEKVTVDGGSYTNVNADELNAMLKNKDFVFVNVHIPFEGDIANTDLSIPYDQITEPANLSQLPANKGAKIVLYCRSGRMSEIAAEALVKLGYTNIWNLQGGMLGWEQAGYSLEGK